MNRPSTINHITSGYDLEHLTERQRKILSTERHIEYLSSVNGRLGKNTMGLIKYYSNKLKQLNKLK